MAPTPKNPPSGHKTQRHQERNQISIVKKIWRLVFGGVPPPPGPLPTPSGPGLYGVQKRNLPNKNCFGPFLVHRWVPDPPLLFHYTLGGPPLLPIHR